MNKSQLISRGQDIVRMVEDIRDNQYLTAAQKNVKLRDLKPLVDEHREAMKRANATAEFRALAAGGNAEGYDTDTSDAAPVQRIAPVMSFSRAEFKAMHSAIHSGTGFRSTELGMKDFTTVEPGLPSVLGIPGIVPIRHEPTRVASLFPSQPAAGPTVRYLRHDTTTGGAGVTAEGAAKPSAVLGINHVDTAVTKIAVLGQASWESISDYSDFQSYLVSELGLEVVETENRQMLSGDGTGENMTGLLTVPGIGTAAKATTDTSLDALQRAMVALRTGAAYTEPDFLVMHPADLGNVRLLKNSLGDYIVGPPAQTGAGMLWGLKVVETTQMPLGTMLIGNSDLAARVFVRQGMFVMSSNAPGFANNLTTFVVEERLTIGAIRPAALYSVTGLGNGTAS